MFLNGEKPTARTDARVTRTELTGNTVAIAAAQEHVADVARLNTITVIRPTTAVHARNHLRHARRQFLYIGNLQNLVRPVRVGLRTEHTGDQKLRFRK